jgi:GntR family transcriptional regulator/MocR family aminotransferase
MDRSKDRRSERSITGSDFLQLTIGDAPAGGRADWLTERLRQAIAQRRLPIGSRLPASRILAAELQVSRGVVTEAYRRLTEDGQLSGHGRAGTVVVATPVGPTVDAAPVPPTGDVFTSAPGDVFTSAPGAACFYALRAAAARIDLSPGLPDLAAFPRAAWLRAERAALDELTPADFGYGDARGAPAFRAAIANWLARTRGISVSPDEVIVVAGVAQAFALLTRVLYADGISAIGVEDPGSLGGRQQLQSWGMATPPIPVDSSGLDVDALRAANVPAVLLTPAHQFPTGVVLDGNRRRELLRWADPSDRGGLIIEDDYDAEHRYDRPPVPALRAMAGDQICYTGSVSKLLAPALRVGWLIVPARYHEAVAAAKRDADLGNAVLPQLVLARLMESGELERQLRFVRRRHRRRRDAMIEAIERHLPSAQVHGAAAGLHLMITFDAAFADADLAAAALARGVKVHPLSWHAQRPGPPGLVLGYAATPPSDLAAGIAAVADALRSV